MLVLQRSERKEIDTKHVNRDNWRELRSSHLTIVMLTFYHVIGKRV